MASRARGRREDRIIAPVEVPGRFLDVLARRLGGTSVLALPMLRILAGLAGVAWVVAAPEGASRATAALVLAGFLLYSVVVIGALWAWPRTLLRLNVPVLLIDLAFALALVHITGGAHSALFVALLLIAALQSYYYGMTRGIAVAVGSAIAYVAVVWPTLTDVENANVIIRLVALLGTSIGVGVLADIEERERMQVLMLSAEGEARERLLAGVVDGIRDGIVAVDADGRVVMWNHVMEIRYGLPAAAARGRDVLDCIPGAATSPWAEPLRRLLRGDIEEFSVPAVETPAPGRRRLVQDINAARLCRPGSASGAVIVLEDVTARIELERTARQAEKLAALGTLAAGLAHELNNPIGIISSRVELMLLDAETRPLPPDVREDLDVLHRHAQRVSRIAHGLLSFARQAPAQPGPVDLNRVLEDALLLVEKQMAKDRITVVRELAPSLPQVWGDANALEQVVVNLLTNARDALSDGGVITVETARVAEPAGVRVAIRDTGPGMTPEVAARVFEPFFTTKPNGTGLGLSISYGIVREHGGTVDVTSEPGKGTTFVLTFPEARERAGAA